MFRIEQEQNTYLNYKLIDTAANAICTITPEKGGMCTSFMIDGIEMIYINPENYYSDVRTRCASPVLFPTLGLCHEDTLWIDEAAYPMGIHGIAHAQPWQVIETNTTSKASITLRLQANEITLASYPFYFSYDLTYCLCGNALTLQVKVHNHGDAIMPFTYGFHPYFKISDVRNLKFEIDGQIQDEQGELKAYEQIEFPYAAETKVTLAKVASPCAFVDKATGRSVKLEFHDDIHYIILWSLCEQQFLCMEPWNSLPNGLNEGQGMMLQPHTSYTTELTFTFES